MKKLVKKTFRSLRDRAGFISIETVIVAGLMIGLGAFAVTQLYVTGQTTTEDAIDRVNQVLDIAVVETPIP